MVMGWFFRRGGRKRAVGLLLDVVQRAFRIAAGQEAELMFAERGVVFKDRRVANSARHTKPLATSATGPPPLLIASLFRNPPFRTGLPPCARAGRGGIMASNDIVWVDGSGCGCGCECRGGWGGTRWGMDLGGFHRSQRVS